MINWKPISTLPPDYMDWFIVYDSNATKHHYKVVGRKWLGSNFYAPQTGGVAYATHWAELSPPEGFRIKVGRIRYKVTSRPPSKRDIATAKGTEP